MKMTIYVADGLKQRMDAVGEGIKWSQVACAAFEQKLGELAAGRSQKSLDDVIQRLRASKLEYEAQAEKSGRRDGLQWARNSASYLNLSNLAANCKGGYEGLDAESFCSRAGIIDWDDREENIEYQVREFWEEIIGERATPGQVYLRGFAAGALEVWQQVCDQL